MEKLQGKYPLKDGSNGKTFETGSWNMTYCVYYFILRKYQVMNSGGMLPNSGKGSFPILAIWITGDAGL